MNKLTLKNKDFATGITLHNTHSMNRESQILQEHVTHNQAVRQILLNRGIHPESLSPKEDVKKIERWTVSAEKKALKNLDGLEE